MIKYLLILVVLFSAQLPAAERAVTAGQAPEPRLEAGDIVTFSGFDNPAFNVDITMLRPITMSGGAWQPSYFNGKVVTSNNAVLNGNGSVWDVAVMTHNVYDKSQHPYVDASWFEFFSPSSVSAVNINFQPDGGVRLIDQDGRIRTMTGTPGLSWLNPVPESPVNLAHYEIRWAPAAMCNMWDGGGGYVGNDSYQTLSAGYSVIIDVSQSEQFCGNHFNIRAKYDHSLSYDGYFYVGHKAIPRVPNVDLSLVPSTVTVTGDKSVLWPQDNMGFQIDIGGGRYPFTNPADTSTSNRATYYQVKYSSIAGTVIDGSGGAPSYFPPDIWSTLGSGGEVWLSGKGRVNLEFRERQFPSDNSDSKLIDFVDRVVTAGEVPDPLLEAGQYVKFVGFTDPTFNGSIIEMLRPITMSGGAWQASYFDGKTLDGDDIYNVSGAWWDVGKLVAAGE